MTDLVPFSFEQSTIHALSLPEPWFVARDVAAALGYRDANKMTRMLRDDEKGTRLVGTLGGPQQVAIINEPGLYRAIFASRAETAERFRRWVLHEVLPTLRKTGSYSTGHQAPPPHSQQQPIVIVVTSKATAAKLARDLSGPGHGLTGSAHEEASPSGNVVYDGRFILRRILSHRVKIRGADYSLGELLEIAYFGQSETLDPETAIEALRDHGLKPRRDYLAISNQHAAIARILAPNRRDRAPNWGSILKRLDGAFPDGQHRFGAGAPQRTTAVPMDLVASIRREA